MEVHEESYEYVGFWTRFGAALIDTVFIIIITFPILFLIYGSEYFDFEETIQGAYDFILSYAFPLIATVLFWIYKAATPGKMVLSAIVDAKTDNKLTIRQSIIRYIGYYISIIPLGLGFISIIFDDKNQGWHDKIAGTIVIRSVN